MTDTATLLQVLSRSPCVSGQALAEQLEVSRTRVWQLVQELRALGYSIRSQPGCGYEWHDTFEPLSSDRLAAQLEPDWTLSLVWHTDSTSNRLVAERSDRHILFAEHQSAARGRVGRHWLSYPGGLFFSAARWFDHLTVGPQSLNPWVAAHAIAALQEIGIDGVSAKWPNDLVIGCRKGGGVLMEIGGDPFGQCHVCVGVGVNWQPPPTVEQPVAGVAACCPPLINRNHVGGALAAAVARALDAFPPADPSEVSAVWRRADGYRGQRVRYSHGDQQAEGVVDGIDPDGALRLVTDSGLERFAAGELHLASY